MLRARSTNQIYDQLQELLYFNHKNNQFNEAMFALMEKYSKDKQPRNLKNLWTWVKHTMNELLYLKKSAIKHEEGNLSRHEEHRNKSYT